MKNCTVCKGSGNLLQEAQTLGGLREVGRTCYKCNGSGQHVERRTYRGLTIIVIDDELPKSATCYVNELKSEFLSYEKCKKVIDGIHATMVMHNIEMEQDGCPEDQFDSLAEYCEDYLSEMC